jgi:hypothetical protein
MSTTAPRALTSGCTTRQPMVVTLRLILHQGFTAKLHHGFTAKVRQAVTVNVRQMG